MRHTELSSRAISASEKIYCRARGNPEQRKQDWIASSPELLAMTGSGVCGRTLNVIASEAKQSRGKAKRLDCFVARAPCNDVERPRNHRTPFAGGPPNVISPMASAPRVPPACPAAAPPAPGLLVRTASPSPGSAQSSWCGPDPTARRSRANCRHSCPGW
jgi:hypothetical protein